MKKQPVSISRQAVSRVTPPVSRGLPGASKRIPLVSGVIPLVSQAPPTTFPKRWGTRPQWGLIPTTRRREITPSQKGLLGLLAIVVTAPASIPIKMISNIAKQVAQQASDELDQEDMLKKIRDEMAMSRVTADK